MNVYLNIFRNFGRKCIMPEDGTTNYHIGVIYTTRAYATMSVSVCLSVTEVHWRIIAKLCFKFRSTFTFFAHCGRGACREEGRDLHLEGWRDHLALC